MRTVVRHKGSCKTCRYSYLTKVPKAGDAEVWKCAKHKREVDCSKPCDDWADYRHNPELAAMHARAFGRESASTGPC